MANIEKLRARVVGAALAYESAKIHKEIIADPHSWAVYKERTIMLDEAIANYFLEKESNE